MGNGTCVCGIGSRREQLHRVEQEYGDRGLGQVGEGEGGSGRVRKEADRAILRFSYKTGRNGGYKFNNHNKDEAVSMENKKVMLSGMRSGRNYLSHEWFMAMLPTLKEGKTLGFPVKGGGIAIFEFKGISKPKSDIKIYGIDNPANFKG